MREKSIFCESKPRRRRTNEHRQNEKITQDKLNLLPAINPSNDMETFQNEYKATSERFDRNKSLLQEKELERAKHEGQEQFDLALEIQDQILGRSNQSSLNKF